MPLLYFQAILQSQSRTAFVCQQALWETENKAVGISGPVALIKSCVKLKLWKEGGDGRAAAICPRPSPVSAAAKHPSTRRKGLGSCNSCFLPGAVSFSSPINAILNSTDVSLAHTPHRIPSHFALD